MVGTYNTRAEPAEGIAKGTRSEEGTACQRWSRSTQQRRQPELQNHTLNRKRFSHPEETTA
ncbi:MAG: hypothetical protein RhofKO_12240 [Rhodothermales bacterium]